MIFVEVSYGLKEKDTSDITYKTGEGVFGNVIKTGNTVLVPFISKCW